jgi:hypothetical protein
MEVSNDTNFDSKCAGNLYNDVIINYYLRQLLTSSRLEIDFAMVNIFM